MKRLLFVLLFACLSTTAFAQLGEISVSFGKATAKNKSLGPIALANGTQDLNLEPGFRFGFRFTINSWRFLGHEFGYAYTRDNFQTADKSASVGVPIHQGFYDFLAYATPEGSKIRPFAAGGVHFSSYYPPGASVFSGNGVTKFGVNYGAGVKVKVSSMFLVRLDFRDYLNPKPDVYTSPSGWVHMFETSGGLAFTF